MTAVSRASVLVFAAVSAVIMTVAAVPAISAFVTVRVVVMVTVYIRIVIKRIRHQRFYSSIRIAGNTSVELYTRFRNCTLGRCV